MLEISVSKNGLDSEWDTFLETRPDGCYQQSSLWARLKASGGWKQLRLVARQQGEIVGGAQILLRPVKSLGNVGYISKGPVLSCDEPAVQDLVLDQLDHAARTEGVLYLKVQPPYGQERLAQRLLERGALPSETVVVSQATARVDIRPEPEAIMARMPRKKRSDIRRSERKGLAVRTGTDSDMSVFQRLLKTHAERQGYYPHSQSYHHNLWSIFSSRGRACLLLAEYEGEALAANLILLFGDVVFSMFLVDNGLHKPLNAQSLLTWKAILWGKEHGCAWFDFGGIPMSAARDAMDDKPIPKSSRGERLARFKMSFGSQVLLRPAACDVSYVWPRQLTSRIVPVLWKKQHMLRSLLGGSIYGDYQ